VYVDGIGSLFGAGEGLIPYAPAFLIGLVGAVAAARRHRAIGWFLFGVAAIHLLVVLPLGFWGVALPGRFAIVLVPLLAIGMAEVIRVAPIVRVGVFALVAMQVVIVVTYHDINTLILDRVPQHEYLAIFPTVDPEPGLASFDLAVSHDPGPVANVDGGSLRSARADGAGVMYVSPQLTMRPGRYRVGLRLLASPLSTPDAVVARLTVWELPDHRSLAERVIRGRDLDGPVGVEFSAPRQPVLWPNRVVVEVATTGVADAQLRSVITRPTTLQRDRDGVIHDGVPLAAAWLAAVAVGAVALFEIDRRRRRAPEVIRRP
jgi:hypothetical protein